MKISWNWLKEMIPTQIAVQKVAEILTDIGLEVESVSPFESIQGGLENLIVGEVISCENHPNADKLKITKINIGKNELLNIVCGAPNVAVAQKVIVAKVGTKIFPINAEPITIQHAKIRGIESEGMLCAADEIGLGSSHEGLFILSQDAIVGSEIKNYFNVYSDSIFEIGLTANHADANAHFGVARELYAALKFRKIEPEILLNQSYEKINFSQSPQNEFEIIVEDKNKCARYSGVFIDNISITESPNWLQNKLKAIGVRTINNIVDITNFILHAYGQPLHAFDSEKISGKKIIVKTLPTNTTFITLDGIERKLSSEDLMICDANGGMCIAGVYGGLSSGISFATKKIFLESAFFNSSAIRKTEAFHGLKTDASSRFAKGTDPENTVKALEIATQMIIEICGGSITSPLIDIYPKEIAAVQIFLRFSRLELIAGLKINAQLIVEILELLYIKIIERNPTGLLLEIPSYKNDVTREIDVIEEILRMLGYHQIPILTSIKTPYIVSTKPDKENIKSKIIHYLASQKFYEIFTNGISRSKYIAQYLKSAESTQVKLLNSLNSELDCMRQSMLFSGLEVIEFNLNRKQSNLKLFEIGRTYTFEKNQYLEKNILSIYITGNKEEENWNHQNSKVDHFYLKYYVENIMSQLNIYNSVSSDVNHPLIDGVELSAIGNLVGVYGSVKQQILKDFDIKQSVYYAELDWNKLVELSANRKVQFKEISKFPEVRRDLALILDPQIKYDQIKMIALKEGEHILKDVFLFDVYEGEKLDGKKSYAIGLTFRNDEKTLTDKDVDLIMKKLIGRYEKELNATIRK